MTTEATVEEKAPKTRKTTRKPKTETDNSDGTETPKKRTRRTKTASGDEVIGEDGQVVVAKKPRKPRAKKNTEAENQLTLSDIADSASTDSAPAEEKKPKRTYKRKPKVSEETSAEKVTTDAGISGNGMPDTATTDGE